MTSEPVAERTERASSPGAQMASAPSSLAHVRCSGCLAVARISVAGESRRSAAMVSRPSVPDADDGHPAGRHLAGGVDRAGQRFHDDGLLVGERLGHLDHLAGVDDHLVRPPAAGRLAEPALQAGLEVAEGDALAQVDAAGRTLVARRGHASGGAGEHGHDDGPPAVLEVADDLVARRERERDDGLEVAGRLAVDGGQVAAADAGQAGAEPQPVGRGQLGRVDVAQRQRPEAGAAPGAQRPGDHGRRVAGGLAREHERLHRRPPVVAGHQEPEAMTRVPTLSRR